MSTKEEPPDLIWFLPAIFALGALISGGIAIYSIFDGEMRAELGVSLFTPISTLLVLAIRANGYWHFLKQRKRAIQWLLAALFASIASAIIESLSLGLPGYLKQHGSIGLFVGYAFSVGVVIYAFELRRKEILR
jgi:hypothetical protein